MPVKPDDFDDANPTEIGSLSANPSAFSPRSRPSALSPPSDLVSGGSERIVHVAKTPTYWKIIIGSLMLATVICAAGWSKSAEDSARRLRFIQSDLEDAQNARDYFRQKLSEALAGSPLVISSVELTNTAEGNSDLGNGPTDDFEKDSIRYINFHLRGPNRFYRLQDLTGQIDVRFISPDGVLDRGSKSPPNFSFSVPIQAPGYEESWDVSSGWGSKDKSLFDRGRWQIEFFDRGKKIGDKSFTVH
jgi:hypothetical protein